MESKKKAMAAITRRGFLNPLKSIFSIPIKYSWIIHKNSCSREGEAIREDREVSAYEGIREILLAWFCDEIFKKL
ncbi:MAG: hypothetical protein QXI05_03515 [Candidatus Bathyarchaeia archaeon]